MDLEVVDGNSDGVTIKVTADEGSEFTEPDEMCEVRIFVPAIQAEDGTEEEPSADAMIPLSLEGAEAVADALHRWVVRRRAAGATG